MSSSSNSPHSPHPPAIGGIILSPSNPINNNNLSSPTSDSTTGPPRNLTASPDSGAYNNEVAPKTPTTAINNNNNTGSATPPRRGVTLDTNTHNEKQILEKETVAGAPITGGTGQNTTSQTQTVLRPRRQGTVDSQMSQRTNAANGGGGRNSTNLNRSLSRQGSNGTAGFGKDANGDSFVKRMTTGLFTPEKKLATVTPTFWMSLKACMKSSYVTWMLIFIPISWALHFTIKNDTVIFVMCFLAIIPLAAILGFATEEVALRVGETIGGLLNATLGNAVELIVAIIALIKCELSIVQSSLIGSILSNILLVLGMCFFAGGTRYAEQTMSSAAGQLNSSLLLIATIAVLIPSTFRFTVTVTTTGAGTDITSEQQSADLLAMSHGVAVILLFLYLGYLAFQLFTHANLYADQAGPSTSTRYPENVKRAPANMVAKLHLGKHRSAESESSEEGNSPITATGDTRAAMARIHGTSSALERQPNMVVDDPNGDLERGAEVEEEEEQMPQMSLWMSVAVMVVDTVLVGVTAEFLVDSINGLVASNPGLSSEWVGLILLPIVGNAAEHVTAVTVATKDKLDLAIGVAVGSSIQISLFVIPVCVLLAWAIGKPLLMLFDPFLSVVLFLSVLVCNQTLSDGRSNWMEGMILMLVYLIIAVSAWYYPGSNTANLVGQAGCS